MSKCACGNEQGKTMVFPKPVIIMDSKTKKSKKLFYMAGMTMPDEQGKVECWYCAVSRRSGNND